MPAKLAPGATATLKSLPADTVMVRAVSCDKKNLAMTAIEPTKFGALTIVDGSAKSSADLATAAAPPDIPDTDGAFEEDAPRPRPAATSGSKPDDTPPPSSPEEPAPPPAETEAPASTPGDAAAPPSAGVAPAVDAEPTAPSSAPTAEPASSASAPSDQQTRPAPPTSGSVTPRSTSAGVSRRLGACGGPDRTDDPTTAA